MASAKTISLIAQNDLFLVHVVQLKPMIKDQISGKLVTNGISDVAIASVNSEKTLTKKMIMIIWRASEASETPSIATYPKQCLGVCTSKPQSACSQFYLKRRSGRACIYEKRASTPACCSRAQLRKAWFTCVKTAKRMHIKELYIRSPLNGNHFLVIITRKMVPITGRARSFLYFRCFKKQNREVGETE